MHEIYFSCRYLLYYKSKAISSSTQQWFLVPQGGRRTEMSNVNIGELQKEMKSLGILNIEADGNFSPELLKDAVDAVKETNFNELAKQAEEEAKRAQ